MVSSDLSIIDSELRSTLHDRSRRRQRNIQKVDLQRARRYGMKTKDGNREGVYKYTYAGHVFVYDSVKNCAITSWKLDGPSPSSGSSMVKPILLKKSEAHESEHSLRLHHASRDRLMREKNSWKSHAVIVVDMSGSMRNDDFNGARCRSDGVFMILARDFVKRQLDSGTASMYDVVSVVLMGDEARIAIAYEPMDWVLYNKLVDYREWTTERPRGAGYYLPAVELAGILLNESSRRCALSLLFFSDGRPSDDQSLYGAIYKGMGILGSSYGRRLMVSCVGVGDGSNEFDVLERMAKEGSAYGCLSRFQQLSLDSDKLSEAISCLATAITSMKTELTEGFVGNTRSLRSDVRRERKDEQDELSVSGDWRHFGTGRSCDKFYTLSVWAWNEHANDFAMVLDPRCYGCFEFVADQQYRLLPGSKGCLCPRCKACYLCPKCLTAPAHDCEKLAQERRNGFIIRKELPSYAVAVKKAAFAEGAERFAFKFRYVDPTGEQFIGTKMVAKESRFVETKADDPKEYLLSNRYSYHRTFMQTQAYAAKYAMLFNQLLDSVEKKCPTDLLVGHITNCPRMRFVAPLIYELAEETDQGLKAYNVLVEPLIEGDYRKWNNNFGATVRNISTAATQRNEEHCVPRSTLKSVAVLLRDTTVNNARGLAMIQECDEVEDDTDCASYSQGSSSPCRLLSQRSRIPPECFAQAFSHFTHGTIQPQQTLNFLSHHPVRSNGSLLVCDLQGSFRSHPNGSCEFILTDPAVHLKEQTRDKIFGNKLVFGRTDRGTHGIEKFFESHTCNAACRLLGLPVYTKRLAKDRHTRI